MGNLYSEEEPQWRKKIDDEIEFIKNLQAFIANRTITFEEYLRQECNEIFGEVNAYYTGQNLKRTPTAIDCQKNYIDHDADKIFHRKNYYRVERRWQRKFKDCLHQMRAGFRKFLAQ